MPCCASQQNWPPMAEMGQKRRRPPCDRRVRNDPNSGCAGRGAPTPASCHITGSNLRYSMTSSGSPLWLQVHHLCSLVQRSRMSSLGSRGGRVAHDTRFQSANQVERLSGMRGVMSASRWILRLQRADVSARARGGKAPGARPHGRARRLSDQLAGVIGGNFDRGDAHARRRRLLCA